RSESIPNGSGFGRSALVACALSVNPLRTGAISMRRSLLTPLAAVGLLAGGTLLAACGGDDDGDAGDDTSVDCDNPPTVSDGVLTIATGEPAFPPYVIDDDPTNKQGFEAAVAYAVAGELGFSDDQVTWVRTGFDEVIAP